MATSTVEPVPAVKVRGPRKQYHGKAAVDGIDLDIERGEVFALLGPNGAGKTTTIEILEGHRRRGPHASDLSNLAVRPVAVATAAPRIGPDPDGCANSCPVFG